MARAASAKGPYWPETRANCRGAHVSIIGVNGEISRCRYCGNLVLGSGKVSKRSARS